MQRGAKSWRAASDLDLCLRVPRLYEVSADRSPPNASLFQRYLPKHLSLYALDVGERKEDGWSEVKTFRFSEMGQRAGKEALQNLVRYVTGAPERKVQRLERHHRPRNLNKVALLRPTLTSASLCCILQSLHATSICIALQRRCLSIVWRLASLATSQPQQPSLIRGLPSGSSSPFRPAGSRNIHH